MQLQNSETLKKGQQHSRKVQMMKILINDSSSGHAL